LALDPMDAQRHRAYADNGRGYALGFDSVALEAAFVRQADAPIQKSFPVTYNDTLLTDIQRGIIEKMFDLISLPRGKGLSEDAIIGYMAELHSLSTVNALHAGLHFKHEAYANEQEYRFMQVHPPGNQPLGTKLRTRSSSSIRYLQFDWKSAGKDVLKKIVIGPAADVERATAFAKDSLLLTDQQAVAIARSVIPYRAT